MLADYERKCCIEGLKEKQNRKRRAKQERPKTDFASHILTNNVTSNVLVPATAMDTEFYRYSHG